MAGAGYKLFQTGDVLTAAQVNTYLNEQTVMVFASSTARTTALSGVLAEGMMSYLQDTNSVEVYNGSSWVNVGNAGDITEVQAGVGISIASGTGPIPVITNSSTDLITTAGDILYGTAADTVARLGIGTAGQVLKVNSGATAPEWGAAAATTAVGCILYNTTNTTLANNTETVLTFDTELLDTDGFHSTVTNTGRITIPTGKGGKYFVFAWGQFGNNVTGYRQIQIVVNGQTGTPNRVANTFVASFNAGLTATGCAILAANDYIELEAYQNSGGNLTFAGGHSDSQFGAIFLGA
jgi:hypothetical protein